METWERSCSTGSGQYPVASGNERIYLSPEEKRQRMRIAWENYFKRLKWNNFSAYYDLIEIIRDISMWDRMPPKLFVYDVESSFAWLKKHDPLFNKHLETTSTMDLMKGH